MQFVIFIHCILYIHYRARGILREGERELFSSYNIIQLNILRSIAL